MPSSPPGGTCGIYLVEMRPVQYWNELRSNNAFLGPLLNEQWNFFMFALWWPGSWTLPFSCFDRTLAEYFIRWAGISASVPLSRPLFTVCLNICIFPNKTRQVPPVGPGFLNKIKESRQTTWPGERYTFRADAISLSTHAAVRPLKMKRHETFVPSRHHIIFEPCISIRNEHLRF